MKRITIFITAVVIFSSGVIFSWIFFKYFHDKRPSILSFPVERGNITETVKVRGEAVSQKEFVLSFASGGTVASILVREGETIREGESIIRLDTSGYELDLRKLSTILTQRQLNLEKLLAGYTVEDVAITETKLANAQKSLSEKKRILSEYLNDSYTKSVNSIGVYVDQFYNNPRSPNATINITVSDFQLKTNLENDRINVEKDLNSWQTILNNLTEENMISDAETAGAYLEKIRTYLEQLALAVNALTPTNNLSSSAISLYRADVSNARSAIGSAITNLSSALESVRNAESAYVLTKSELRLKTSDPRSEDVATAKAQIAEIESDMASIRDKMRKAVLVAPIEARVMKIFVERGETLMSGQTAVILATSQNKIQADISELDIVKIPEESGTNARIRFDAFPDLEFTGKVVSIEPREIVKDGDKYYRVNLYFDAGGTLIRSGMSADLDIFVAEKENILIIPDFAVYQKDRQNFVKIMDGSQEKEIRVITGLSDGANIEIISGLDENQTVIVSAN